MRLSKDSSLKAEQELERIRVEATRKNIEAGYQHSSLALEKQDSLPLNSKKIEEDYTMFDEQIDQEVEL